MSTNKKKIPELIEEDCIHASVLHHFGVAYYSYSENSLSKSCKKHGVNLTQLEKDLEQVNMNGDEHDLFLISYPLEVIIEYLKRSHYNFIKLKLPNIMLLLNDTMKNNDDGILKDLQFAIPIFIDDFIRHIHEEEATFFKNILYLKSTNHHEFNPGKLFYFLEKNTIHNFAAQHELAINKMVSLRNISNDYFLQKDACDSIKRLFIALEAFENELIKHTKIENEILFPKALTIENKVRKKFRKTIAFN